ncbi:hypothetical protein SAY86_007597 [Trapa natans]|uniref:Uncharacterized protein n=1 Tax=Trapa natans TaxID=22666 RepID=A0AAN7L8L3_TRANT|nr:hypothetical protein SAY86_007597 [Trapa natans]
MHPEINAVQETSFLMGMRSKTWKPIHESWHVKYMWRRAVDNNTEPSLLGSNKTRAWICFPSLSFPECPQTDTNPAASSGLGKKYCRHISLSASNDSRKNPFWRKQLIKEFQEMGSLWGISSNTHQADPGIESLEYMEMMELDMTESEQDPDLRATPWSWSPRG